MPWTPWAGLALEQPGRLGYSLIIFDPKAITGGSASCSTAPPIRTGAGSVLPGQAVIHGRERV